MADGEGEEEARYWRPIAVSPSDRGPRQPEVCGLAVLAFYLPARGSEIQLRSRCAKETSILEDLSPNEEAFCCTIIRQVRQISACQVQQNTYYHMHLASRSSSSSSPSDTSTLSYGSDHHLTQHQHQAMLEPQHMIGGSSAGIFATAFPTVESIRDDMIERSPFDPYDTEKLQASCGLAKVVAGGKWSAVPAAKMKITRKMGEPSSGVTGGAATTAPKKPRRRAQAYEDHGHDGAMGQAFGVIRVCSDCNTTKTPLWRSGPCGPKSLCNACGIRQRKARQAMMVSGPPGTPNAASKLAAQNDAVVAAQPNVKKEKRADVDRSSLPFKKRCKVVQVQDQTPAPTTTNAAAAMEETAESATVAPPPAPTTRGGTLVDSIGLSWSKTHATATASSSCSFRPSPVAPSFAAVQDEITDAAMLLMALSCGLVRS